jgi:hypothetical protein
MTTSTCTFLLYSCFIRIDIEWEDMQRFVHAREAVAKALGAELLYCEEKTEEKA